METDICRICQNAEGNKLHVAREMMFGFRDAFTYFECSKCGCVQIREIPKNLSKYYPPNYYSFGAPSSFKAFLRRQWAAYALNGKNVIGRLITWHHGKNLPVISVSQAQVSKEASILDIGCGSGQLILDLWHLGFKKVMGIDPFIEHDITYPEGPKVLKQHLQDFRGEFDVVMLHSSFEHMDHPAEVFAKLAEILKPNGLIILRIPVAASFAWRHYGVHWIQLDAPRHLFLHTVKSIQMLAERVGLTVHDTVFESDEGQFWGSEQHMKDIPILDKRSYAVSRRNSIFTRRDIAAFKARAVRLNEQKDGDAACFYLRKLAAT